MRWNGALIADRAAFFVPPQSAYVAQVPRLFAELGVPIRSVNLSRPTLDDVFMSHTGSTIRDAEESGNKMKSRMAAQMLSGARR